jgi:hypothetical protein
MFHKRKDKGCEAKVMAVVGNRVLIEAKWPKNNRNIVFVDKDYFEARYGVTV